MIHWFLTLLFISVVPHSSSAGIYQQCGGDGYTGSMACDWPLQCFRRSRWFSSCQTNCPAADWDCAKWVDYASGAGVARAWDQCGGDGWNGLNGCAEYTCQWRSQWYAQCRPDCPVDWLCRGSVGASTHGPVNPILDLTDYATALPTDSGVDSFDTVTPSIPLETLSPDDSSSTDSDGSAPSETLFDDISGDVLGRFVVSQMLGSDAYDMNMHPLETAETSDAYDIIVDHIIAIVEMEEPGSMERFGVALQAEDLEERLGAWENMRERVLAVSENPQLMDTILLNPLFTSQLQLSNTRIMRITKDACKGSIPDIGKVNGLYGDDGKSTQETLSDALQNALIQGAPNAAVLTAIESGVYKPDPESRLGAFYATRGRKSGTVGSAVHRAIGAIYLIFGSVGEERIGRVFNDKTAIALYDEPVESASGKCMADIEHLYWSNVKKENSGSFGGKLGKYVTPPYRDCIQQLLSGSLCSMLKPFSLKYQKQKDQELQITERQSRTRRQLTGLTIPAGYTKTNYRCMNKSVYCNSKASSAVACIVEDRTSHKGGVWKAGPEKTWGQKGCPTNLRSGTYDANLKWIAP